MRDRIDDTMKTIIFGVALLVALGSIIFATVMRWSHEEELARLRNEVATKDSTAEIQEGVFTRLSQEKENLQILLDARDQKVSELLLQVKKGRQELLTVNQLALRWKAAYEATGAANQVDVVGTGPIRKRVDFSKNFGVINASGWTLTDPAEYSLKLEQLRPLVLTLALAQDATGAWHSYVTSDDVNTVAEIKVSAVNPYVLEPHWYQRLRLHGFLAGGKGDAGFGVMAGGGISYDLGKFEVGPAVFVTASDRVDKYLGLTVGWRPF